MPYIVRVFFYTPLCVPLLGKSVWKRRLSRLPQSLLKQRISARLKSRGGRTTICPAGNPGLPGKLLWHWTGNPNGRLPTAKVLIQGWDMISYIADSCHWSPLCDWSYLLFAARAREGADVQSSGIACRFSSRQSSRFTSGGHNSDGERRTHWD